MGIEKWYEVSCDVCGETVHTRGRNKEELKQYGFILIGKKVYCVNCFNKKYKTQSYLKY